MARGTVNMFNTSMHIFLLIGAGSGLAMVIAPRSSAAFWRSQMDTVSKHQNAIILLGLLKLVSCAWIYRELKELELMRALHPNQANSENNSDQEKQPTLSRFES